MCYSGLVNYRRNSNTVYVIFIFIFTDLFIDGSYIYIALVSFRLYTASLPRTLNTIQIVMAASSRYCKERIAIFSKFFEID